MSKLNTTKEIVRGILERDQRARNSDNYLYLKVIEYFEKEYNVSIRCQPLWSFLLYGCDNVPVPPFESVRRTRQKVQEKFPELAASEEVEAFRLEEEREYLALARS